MSIPVSWQSFPVPVHDSFTLTDGVKTLLQIAREWEYKSPPSSSICLKAFHTHKKKPKHFAASSFHLSRLWFWSWCSTWREFLFNSCVSVSFTEIWLHAFSFFHSSFSVGVYIKITKHTNNLRSFFTEHLKWSGRFPQDQWFGAFYLKVPKLQWLSDECLAVWIIWLQDKNLYRLVLRLDQIPHHLRLNWDLN